MYARTRDRVPAPATSARAVATEAPAVRRAVEPRILQLQRTHGNRFVQRVVGAGGGDVPADLEQRIDRASGGGRPLDRGVRGRMESAFGADFGPVRVHADPEADALNRAVSARAFTTGSDVFFADGEYAPGSASGRELIAHELTHVVQQTGGVQAKLRVTDAGDADEREADAVARAVVQHDEAAQEADS